MEKEFTLPTFTVTEESSPVRTIFNFITAETKKVGIQPHNIVLIDSAFYYPHGTFAKLKEQKTEANLQQLDVFDLQITNAILHVAPGWFYQNQFFVKIQYFKDFTYYENILPINVWAKITDQQITDQSILSGVVHMFFQERDCEAYFSSGTKEITPPDELRLPIDLERWFENPSLPSPFKVFHRQIVSEDLNSCSWDCFLAIGINSNADEATIPMRLAHAFGGTHK